MTHPAELAACTPAPIHASAFNEHATIPYGCTPEDIHQAMSEFVTFLGFINQQLYTKDMPRLETMLMAANFSSVVSEFMTTAIPKTCTTLVKNRFHNGHPDLLPAGVFENDAVQHSTTGMEVKASRYQRGWQGHNAEDVWLLVFVFESNRPADASKSIAPKPFQFLRVVGAQLTKADWAFAGRSATSRRTITASIAPTGFKKLTDNWIYDVNKRL